MSDGPTTPEFTPATPAEKLLAGHGNRWEIRRETLEMWTAALRTGSSVIVLVGSPLELIAKIEASEQEMPGTYLARKRRRGNPNPAAFPAAEAGGYEDHLDLAGFAQEQPPIPAASDVLVAEAQRRLARDLRADRREHPVVLAGHSTSTRWMLALAGCPRRPPGHRRAPARTPDTRSETAQLTRAPTASCAVSLTV